MASALFVRNNISVGASGALFGLLGAMLSELLTNWSIYENKVYSTSDFESPYVVPSSISRNGLLSYMVLF